MRHEKALLPPSEYLVALVPALPPGEPHAAISHLHLVPVHLVPGWEVFNKVVGVDPLGGVDHPLPQGRVRLDVALPGADIVRSRVVEIPNGCYGCNQTLKDKRARRITDISFCLVFLFIAAPQP